MDLSRVAGVLAQTSRSGGGGHGGGGHGGGILGHLIGAAIQGVEDERKNKEWDRRLVAREDAFETRYSRRQARKDADRRDHAKVSRDAMRTGYSDRRQNELISSIMSTHTGAVLGQAYPKLAIGSAKGKKGAIGTPSPQAALPDPVALAAQLAGVHNQISATVNRTSSSRPSSGQARPTAAPVTVNPAPAVTGGPSAPPPTMPAPGPTPRKANLSTPPAAPTPSATTPPTPSTPFRAVNNPPWYRPAPRLGSVPKTKNPYTPTSRPPENSKVWPPPPGPPVPPSSPAAIPSLTPSNTLKVPLPGANPGNSAPASKVALPKISTNTTMSSSAPGSVPWSSLRTLPDSAAGSVNPAVAPWSARQAQKPNRPAARLSGMNPRIGEDAGDIKANKVNLPNEPRWGASNVPAPNSTVANMPAPSPPSPPKPPPKRLTAADIPLNRANPPAESRWGASNVPTPDTRSTNMPAPSTPKPAPPPPSLPGPPNRVLPDGSRLVPTPYSAMKPRHGEGGLRRLDQMRVLAAHAGGPPTATTATPTPEPTPSTPPASSTPTSNVPPKPATPKPRPTKARPSTPTPTPDPPKPSGNSPQEGGGAPDHWWDLANTPEDEMKIGRYRKAVRQGDQATADQISTHFEGLAGRTSNVPAPPEPTATPPENSPAKPVGRRTLLSPNPRTGPPPAAPPPGAKPTRRKRGEGKPKSTRIVAKDLPAPKLPVSPTQVMNSAKNMPRLLNHVQLPTEKYEQGSEEHFKPFEHGNAIRPLSKPTDRNRPGYRDRTDEEKKDVKKIRGWE